MANVSVSNTTGLYIGSGSATVLNNAQQLLSLLSNNGGVTFSLDPAYGNSRVEAFGNYSNADVASFLSSYTGNIRAGNIAVINGITTSTLVASGNVTASYFFGNGSQLTGLPSLYTNANVASYLPTYSGNLVSLQGNVITTANISANNFVTTGTLGNISGANYVNANFFTGNGSLLTGITAGNYGNANVAAYLASNSAVTILTTANITTSANVQGNYILGNAAFLTGIPTGNYSNVNVAAYLPTYTGNLVSLAGNVVTTANVTAAYHIGNGSTLTNLTGANVSGTVANATYASQAGQANTANTATTSQFVTGLTSANVTTALGYVPLNSNSAAVSAGLATYVTGNAQANITSVGTLTSLTVTGNITSSAGNVSGLYILGNGSALTGLPTQSGTYSNANVASYLASNSAVTILTTANITTSANAQAAYFLGDGSQLTNLPSGNYSNANVASYLPTYTGNIQAGNIQVLQNTTINGNVMTNPANTTVFGNLNQLMGNTYIGSDATLFNATTTATGSAGLAGQAPIRIGGQYTVTGNASVQMGTMMIANLALGRPNTNTGARVRINYVGGVFDANGYASTIGLSPFSDGGSQTNLITGITRAPQNTISLAPWNSQGPSGNAVTISSLVTQSSLASFGQTSANITCTYAVAINGAVSVSANTNQVTNATAFRADFVNTQANAALLGNRLAFECIDATANIKIAGNIVSTVGAVVAANVTLKGYTETINSTAPTGGTFTPNVSNATIYSGTLTSNLTFSAFSNPVAGQSATVIITQGGSGSNTLTSTMKFANNTKTLSTAVGAIDIISVFYDGSTYYASLTTGYA